MHGTTLIKYHPTVLKVFIWFKKRSSTGFL